MFVKCMISSALVTVCIFMSQFSMANEIQVQVSGVDANRPGNILVMLFAAAGFPKDHSKALLKLVVPAEQSVIAVKLHSVPNTFAIKVLHDENGDGRVTKNWTGVIPAEGLGFSNGARLRFGPPRFNRAKLQRAKLTGPVSITIAYP